MGETCVPVSPQRIVVLTALDSVLVLGVKPIGAATYEMNQFRSFLTEQTEGIENIGVIGQPSLEKIVRLQPDLIMGTYPIEIYAQLSKIAPTVIFFDGDKAYSKWQNAFKAYADVLGKTQEADRILNEYQQRVGEFRARMGEQISKTQVSLVNFFATDVRIYFKQCIGGQVIEEAGFLRSPFQDKDEWSVENLSLEAIPQMAGDVIFLLLGGHEPSKLDQFIKHPLWSQLEAVQTSKVYEVSSEIWISGSTPVDANLILDDLFKHLIDK
ncbi:MAG: iron-siderophore ABC transporter substrate-binding protein [Timaviella obliquedivisa GSE-PSE-MK23-08B]|jgi:iron complex transport system substrate-binding protein|nr:iron-siderophore ABC transporter substrate-binding protein [Timaviella obliquedivisa GSE-PSE-MK23-08B]